ncbi:MULTISPECIES: hypothetical protein [unclassified Psychrobacter]|uniref:hypothetical protein n=1 Tax=unclassified Psychrobacter TaxID=196806 RepID=UPI001787B9A0|nr:MULTISPECIES: hypothetical protein [unclassified Psychrobacter]MBE0446267.1 hypothetical protein [Psychrobacter sp. FME5]
MSNFITYNNMIINVDTIKMVKMTRPPSDGKDGDFHRIEIIRYEDEAISLAPIYKDTEKANAIFKDIAKNLESKNLTTEDW